MVNAYKDNGFGILQQKCGQKMAKVGLLGRISLKVLW